MSSAFNIIFLGDLGPFHKHGLTQIPAWVSEYIRYKVWNKITYPIPKFNGATVEVREWINNFMPYLSVLWLRIIPVNKKGPWRQRSQGVNFDLWEYFDLSTFNGIFEHLDIRHVIVVFVKNLRISTFNLPKGSSILPIAIRIFYWHLGIVPMPIGPFWKNNRANIWMGSTQKTNHQGNMSLVRGRFMWGLR